MYLIFAGTAYYASGGANDPYHHNLSDRDEVIELAASIIGKQIKCKDNSCRIDGECMCNGDIEWVHVYCTDFDEIIFKAGKPYGDDCGLFDKEV